MYINPFLAGILATIFVEVVAIVIVALIKIKKQFEFLVNKLNKVQHRFSMVQHLLKDAELLTELP